MGPNNHKLSKEGPNDQKLPNKEQESKLGPNNQKSSNNENIQKHESKVGPNDQKFANNENKQKQESKMGPNILLKIMGRLPVFHLSKTFMSIFSMSRPIYPLLCVFMKGVMNRAWLV